MPDRESFSVKLLNDNSGVSPFETWYAALRDLAARARVRARITRLQAGNFGDCKGVGGGVSELRIDYGPGYRVYFARHGRAVIVLLGGGDKTTQRGDIVAATAMWKEFGRDTKGFQRDFQP